MNSFLLVVLCAFFGVVSFSQSHVIAQKVPEGYNRTDGVNCKGGSDVGQNTGDEQACAVLCDQNMVKCTEGFTFITDNAKQADARFNCLLKTKDCKLVNTTDSPKKLIFYEKIRKATTLLEVQTTTTTTSKSKSITTASTTRKVDEKDEAATLALIIVPSTVGFIVCFLVVGIVVLIWIKIRKKKKALEQTCEEPTETDTPSGGYLCSPKGKYAEETYEVVAEGKSPPAYDIPNRGIEAEADPEIYANTTFSEENDIYANDASGEDVLDGDNDDDYANAAGGNSDDYANEGFDDPYENIGVIERLKNC